MGERMLKIKIGINGIQDWKILKQSIKPNLTENFCKVYKSQLESRPSKEHANYKMYQEYHCRHSKADLWLAVVIICVLTEKLV